MKKINQVKCSIFATVRSDKQYCAEDCYYRYTEIVEGKPISFKKYKRLWDKLLKSDKHTREHVFNSLDATISTRERIDFMREKMNQAEWEQIKIFQQDSRYLYGMSPM